MPKFMKADDVLANLLTAIGKFNKDTQARVVSHNGYTFLPYFVCFGVGLCMYETLERKHEELPFKIEKYESSKFSPRSLQI